MPLRVRDGPPDPPSASGLLRPAVGVGVPQLLRLLETVDTHSVPFDVSVVEARRLRVGPDQVGRVGGVGLGAIRLLHTREE